MIADQITSSILFASKQAEAVYRAIGSRVTFLERDRDVMNHGRPCLDCWRTVVHCDQPLENIPCEIKITNGDHDDFDGLKTVRFDAKIAIQESLNDVLSEVNRAVVDGVEWDVIWVQPDATVATIVYLKAVRR